MQADRSDTSKAKRARADRAIQLAYERSEAFECDLSKACVSCRHWFYVEGDGSPVTDKYGNPCVEGEDPKRHETAWGSCKRYPKVAEPQPNGDYEWVFPGTNYYDHCGEFSPANASAQPPKVG